MDLSEKASPRDWWIISAVIIAVSVLIYYLNPRIDSTRLYTLYFAVGTGVFGAFDGLHIFLSDRKNKAV